MQHTLIPYADRKRLHREYFTRVVIVSLFMLCVATVVGSGALFPAYLRAWLSNRAAESAISTGKNAKADTLLAEINKQLVDDEKLVEFATTKIGSVQFSDVIRGLISVRGRSSISAFSITRTDAKTFQIAIAGSSPNRDELIALKNRLEMLIPGNKIDLPIEQLAKNSNIPFSLQFTEKLK